MSAPETQEEVEQFLNDAANLLCSLAEANDGLITLGGEDGENFGLVLAATGDVGRRVHELLVQEYGVEEVLEEAEVIPFPTDNDPED